MQASNSSLMTDELELQTLLDLAIQAARKGGAVLMAHREEFETHVKGPSDFVTDADFASQKAIREILLTARSQDLFLGEETEEKVTAPNDGSICWVVDPLDGTLNYVHGFPCYATSVAAVQNGQVIVGAIYDPQRDELFGAARGLGATLNGKPIKTSDSQHLKDSLVAVSLPAEVQPDSQDLRDFVTVAQQCRAIRRTGSAALNLAYVAASRLDAHWALQIYPWDAAAGTLLIEEAGGTVTDRHGKPYDVWKAHYFTTATANLHKDLCPYLGITL